MTLSHYSNYCRASTDIPNAEQVRRLLKDLRETRQAKTRLGIQSLDDESLMVILQAKGYLFPNAKKDIKIDEQHVTYGDQ